jgi:hypothetical protein
LRRYNKEIKEHSSKYGGQSLTEEELREVFRDFDTSGRAPAKGDPRPGCNLESDRDLVTRPTRR